MNFDHFHYLFSPQNIAVIGASNTEGSVGYSLMKNLTDAAYTGAVFPVNPKYPRIFDLPAYGSVSSISESIDLAILATPASSIPALVKECGEKGIKALVIISAGFKEIGDEGKRLMEETETYVSSYGMTALGPNCLGFLRPHNHLNASFGRKMAHPGSIAFLSQSGALGSSILDWSYAQNVGFSAFISVGDMMDVGFSDLIRYFTADPQTKSIVMYMESLENARDFLQAARECVKTKPIIVLKVGRSAEGSHAAQSHTGSLTGNDAVFDAAFARAGIVRVNTVSELFDAAKTLAMQPTPHGDRLAVVTNAGGPGVIATDELISLGGHLASLSGQTKAVLDQTLPSHWSHGNPIDVLGDADATRYKTAVEACLTDEGVDGVLAILTPQAMTDAIGVAHLLVDSFSKSAKPILTSFMGEEDVNIGSVALEAGHIPSFEEPERAVRAFLNMYTYGKGVAYLDAPTQIATSKYSPKTEENRAIIADVRSKGRHVLTEPEAKQFLNNYGIPMPQGRFVRTKDDLPGISSEIPAPYAMKIVSPDILHKTDVGGVRVGLSTGEELLSSYDEIYASVRSHTQEASIDGVYVETMVHKRFELLLGCKRDPVFGPVIVFGSGGVAVEVFKDTAISLPPLDIKEARRLIAQTKISTLLSGYRGMPGVDMEALTLLLCRFSQLMVDFPEISECDVNPLAADRDGFAVLDAKILLDMTASH